LEEKLRAHPAIYIRDYVVVEEKKPISEFALIARETDVERRIESILFHSKAELRVRATFNIKAGFDFRDPRFKLHLDPGLKRARLDLPPPKVLSQEMIRYDVLVDRNGWWNRISESEKALAMRSMQAEAKLEAIRAGILGDCREALEKEMADVARNKGVEFEFRYRMSGDTLAEIPASG
jgi:hypothetical protein